MMKDMNICAAIITTAFTTTTTAFTCKVNDPNVDQKSGPADISALKEDNGILKTATARENKI